jgi:hypothetical protein
MFLIKKLSIKCDYTHLFASEISTNFNTHPLVPVPPSNVLEINRLLCRISIAALQVCQE